MDLLSNNSVENLSLSEKKEYYESLKKQCLLLKDDQLRFGQGMIKRVYPLFRSYKIELEGEENIPKDSNVLFLVNHSNSHDIFTGYEFFSLLNRRGSVMVATDCLNPITVGVFYASNATLLDRRKKEDRNNSIFRLSKKILMGNDGLIFGESTWNLHPVLPMHNIKNGVSKVSAITQVPIIPTIFEYVEEDGLFQSEGQLYKKCIIRFGKPVMINCGEDLISQTNKLRQEMINMRRKVWSDNGIKKDNIRDIDPSIYVNHTYLKKFKSFGFTYDSPKEQEFLLFLGDEPKENEYTITPNGQFLPGYTEKKDKLGKILYK